MRSPLYRRMASCICLVLLLSAPMAAFAAGFPDVVGTRFADGVTYLQSLGVIVGDPDGSYYPLRTITRAEAAKIIVSILGRVDEALVPRPAAFPDTAGHWANGYIAVAKSLGIIHGFPDNTFAPQAPVTYAQMAKMLVEASGNQKQAGLSWPEDYLFVAVTKGMFTGISTNQPDAQALRGDCGMMTAHTVQHVAHPTTGRTLYQSVFERAKALSLSPPAATVRPGNPVSFQAVLRDAAGNALPGLPVGFSVSDRTNAVISQTGSFQASVPGTYIVQAAGAGLSATALVTVSMTATGLRATPAAQTLSANGQSKGEILVELLDAAGNRMHDAPATAITMSYATDGNNGAVTLGTTSVTSVDGVARFELTAKTQADRTDTLAFRATGYADAEASVTTVTPVAIAILVSAEPASLLANAVSSAAVTASVVDQSGAVVTSGVRTLTFAIAGDGTWANGATAPVARTTLSGRATQTVYSIAGQPGLMTITVSGEGLATGSIQIPTHIAGVPAGLDVAVSDDTLAAGVTSTSGNVARLQVELVDAQGRPTNHGSNLTVTVRLADGSALSTKGLAVTGDLTLDAGHTRTADLIIRASSSSAGVAGTHLLRAHAEALGLVSAPFEITVVPGTASKVSLSITEAAKLAVGKPTTPITVQLIDAAGNAVAQSGVTVTAGWQDPGTANLGKPTINGVYNPPTSPTHADAVKMTTNANGQATFTFVAQAYVGDDYRLIFRVGSTSITSPTISIVNSTASETLVRFTNASGGTLSRLYADQSETAHVHIVVNDDNGNPMGNWDVEVEFGNAGQHVKNVAVVAGTSVKAYSGGKITLRTVNSPGSPAHGTVELSFKGALAGSFSVTARPLTAAPGASGSRGFRIDAGTAVVGVRVTKPDGSAASGLTVQGDVPVELRLVAVDNGGNPMRAPGDVTVKVHNTQGIYSSTGGTEFRTAPASVSVPQGGLITIGRGATSVALYYVQGSNATNVTIGVRAHAAAFTAYSIEAISATLTGATSSSATFKVTDGNGNALGGVRLAFEASSGTAPAETTTASDGRATVTWSGGSGGTLVAIVKNALSGDGASIEAMIGWPAP